MMKRILIFLLIGAAFAALSFLLAGFESDIVQGIRWAMFVFGLIVSAVCCVALVFSVRSGRKRKLLPEGAEYRRKDSLMSKPELELYRTLCGMLAPARYAVLPQIALVSVIDKIKGGGFRNELFRVADFCIADARTFAPLLLIELNDSSHNREERRLRDDKVAALCEAADLPVVTLGMNDGASAIRSALRRYL